MRLTLTDDDRLVVHAPSGERAPTPNEVQAIREALEAPGMPLWFDAAAVVLGVAALLIVFGPRVGA